MSADTQPYSQRAYVQEIVRATAAQWAATGSFVLQPYQMSIETDTLVIKVGDGVTTYPNLTAVGGGGSGTIPPTPSTAVGRDANGNAFAVGFEPSSTTVATAAGTTVLTAASTQIQRFTGSTTQTITLPVVSTLAVGFYFNIVNLSTGILTVNSSGANLVISVLPGASASVTVNAITGTSATSWDAAALPAAFLVPNTQTGTTYTILATDNGRQVTFNNASAITVTVPTGLGAGFSCICKQLGAGQVTFTGSGLTIHNRQSQLKMAGQYAICSLIADIADGIVLAGDTSA